MELMIILISAAPNGPRDYAVLAGCMVTAVRLTLQPQLITF
jgi:hypothetical protein